MPMARCALCDRLVFIKPGPHKHAGGRERWWYPIPHEDADGKPCDGEKRGL